MSPRSTPTRSSEQAELPLVIFGAGPLASLLRKFLDESGCPVGCFVVDPEYRTADSFEGLPLLSWPEFLHDTRFAGCSILIAAGYKSMPLRAQLAERVLTCGRQLGRFVANGALVSSGSKLGEGCILFPGVIVEPGARVGSNNLFWSGTIICHDTMVGSHNYFSPRVTVSGNCTIGDRCFFGVGATLIDGLSVGDDCHIRPGALLYESAGSTGVYGGVPATRRRDVDPESGVRISR